MTQDLRYYLADERDTVRLMVTGSIEAAHDDFPTWYFFSEKAAKEHPMADGLIVHSCPAYESIPGVGVGGVLADAVMADHVYRGIAERFAEIGAAE